MTLSVGAVLIHEAKYQTPTHEAMSFVFRTQKTKNGEYKYWTPIHIFRDGSRFYDLTETANLVTPFAKTHQNQKMITRCLSCEPQRKPKDEKTQSLLQRNEKILPGLLDVTEKRVPQKGVLIDTSNDPKLVMMQGGVAVAYGVLRSLYKRKGNFVVLAIFAVTTLVGVSLFGQEQPTEASRWDDALSLASRN